VDPKSTAEAPVKPVPVIVICVPPTVAPDVGEIDVIDAVGPTKLNWSAVTLAFVPAGVVTKMFARPGEPAGDTAVIRVSESTVKLSAATDLKATAVAPVNPLPVMVTVVPPPVEPDVGEIDEITRGLVGEPVSISVFLEVPLVGRLASPTAVQWEESRQDTASK